MLRRWLAGAVVAAFPSVPAAGASEPAAPVAVSQPSGLPGWSGDDQAAALAAFLRTCRRALRPDRACRAAGRARGADTAAARHLFETWFDAVPRTRPDREDGFLTGYYEPEFAASPTRTAAFGTPLLARPAGLVVIETAPRPAGWPGDLTAALLAPGGFEALPDRGGIESGTLGAAAPPLAYLDPVDAFMVHVQGSARLALVGGGTMRVGFDGRNGYPYTAVARIVAEREGLPPSAVTADRLVDWLRTHPDLAAEVMGQNRSYIFFRRVADGRAGDGPVGAAGVPLTAGRSLAVDRRVTAYGTPVWLEGEVPSPAGGTVPMRRLVIAQDTGAAIVGPARGDLFFGSGAEAGREASLLRHPVRWTELRPRTRPRPPSEVRAP